MFSSGKSTSVGLATLVLWACSGSHGHLSQAPNPKPVPEPDAASGQDAGTAEPDAGALPACKACTKCEETIPVTSANHVLGTVDYPDPPPVGGDHNPCWVAFGVYDQPVPVERWVHNLEHGGVVLLYNCIGGCPAEVAAMTKFVRSHTQALLTPYALNPKKFAIVSWGHRIVTDCFDSAQFQAFYEAHVNMAPESIVDPPSSSLCN